MIKVQIARPIPKSALKRNKGNSLLCSLQKSTEVPYENVYTLVIMRYKSVNESCFVLDQIILIEVNDKMLKVKIFFLNAFSWWFYLKEK